MKFYGRIFKGRPIPTEVFTDESSHRKQKEMGGKLESHVDHLVIGANTLEEGQNYVYETLGVLPGPGGLHPKMGTHNLLLKLGNSIYLEVIAPDRDAAPPERPRWFGLDKFSTLTKPGLLTWVVRTNHIDQAVKKVIFDCGEIENMNRGNLDWLITITRDETMPMEGIAPALIQWKTGQHPALSLAESGCSFLRMEGTHPNANDITESLLSIGFEGAFRVKSHGEDQKPSLIAFIETPWGIKKLIS